MNPNHSLQATKKSWLLVFSILVFSIGFYGFLAGIIERFGTRAANSDLAARPFFVAFAVIALIASLVWLRFRIDGKIGGEGRQKLLSPEQFQTDSIVALALAEACSTFGLALFFMGAPISDFAFFAFGTLFVDFAFILPRGIQFWATQK